MYQSSYCARMAEENRGKYVCSIMIFCFAPSMLFAGIIYLAILSDHGFTIVGVAILLLGLGFMAIGIALCYCMRRDAIKRQAEQPNTIPGQPLVSGTAPPGAIRGHFLQQPPQQTQYSERQTASAPNYPQSPPSYTEVAGKY